MEFGGRYLLAANRLEVWRALNDTDILGAAIPGCRRIAWSGPDRLDLDVEVNLGVAHPVFRGELTLSNVTPAESYTLDGHGKGGLLGLAHGAADVALSDRNGGTELVFSAHGGASNRIMQIGKALIGHSAQRVIDGFFERLAAAMNAEITVLEPEV